jgi:uncharacterized protein YndB with AHSA1/START domain
VWEDITPLARNEWICWVTSGKKAETRGIRIKKALSKLKGGMRRPCFWTGCPHRSKKLLIYTPMNKITIKTTINARISKVWDYWTKPEHITKWAFASDDWEAPHAENDLRVGGKFKSIMAAKDKSASFDFTGIYTAITENKLIAYDIDDGRHVEIQFEETPNGVKITETFDAESENVMEKQRAGWQAILDNFKKYAEAQK